MHWNAGAVHGFRKTRTADTASRPSSAVHDNPDDPLSACLRAGRLPVLPDFAAAVCPHEAPVSGTVRSGKVGPSPAPSHAGARCPRRSRLAPASRAPVRPECRALRGPPGPSVRWRAPPRSGSACRGSSPDAQSPAGAQGIAAKLAARGAQGVGHLDGQLGHRLGLERAASRKQLEEDDPQRPDVGPRVDALRSAASARATCTRASP